MTATLAGSGALFMLGLAGSLHCAAMCGPLSCALPRAPNSPRLPLALYHLARAFSYAILGVVIWHLGKPLRLSLSLPWLAALVCLPLLLYALFPRPWTPSWLGRVHLSLSRPTQAWPAWSRHLSLGALSPLLPCGLLYMAAAATAAASGASAAATWMLAFTAGTVPVLVVAQAGFSWASSRLSNQASKAIQRASAGLAATVILAMAIFH